MSSVLVRVIALETGLVDVGVAVRHAVVGVLVLVLDMVVLVTCVRMGVHNAVMLVLVGVR